MSKKSSTTTDQTTHNVLTPTNPQWVTDPVQNLVGRISDLSSADPRSFVAGANPLQTQAAQGAGDLSGSWWNFDGAADAYRGAINGGANTYGATTGAAASVLPNLQAYMSPYTRNVVDSALADYDFGAGQTRAQNQLALANDATFGGSNGAIQTALSNDAITRGRGTLAAQLLDQGYQAGAALANQDADRAQQMSLANLQAANSAAQYNAQARDQALQRQMAAAQGLVDTSTALDETQRANIASQAQMGDALRQIDALGLTAPISLLQTQAGLLGGLPLSLFHGEVNDGANHTTSTTTESDPIGQFATLAGGLNSLMGMPLGASNFGSLFR
jgi:hypothetical protein